MGGDRLGREKTLSDRRSPGPSSGRVRWTDADGWSFSLLPSLLSLLSPSRRSFASLKRSNHPNPSEPQTHQTSRCTSTHRLTVRSEKLPSIQLFIAVHFLFSLPFLGHFSISQLELSNLQKYILILGKIYFILFNKFNKQLLAID